jgi:aldose 1-epimerase
VTVHPTGDQWTITHGVHVATIVEVGGGLRSYAVDGTEVVAGYAPVEVCRSGRGQLLMPWPNRIRDGRYDFAGTPHQLAITEPARQNASHGLVRWAPWRLADRQPDALTVEYRLFPQPGWDGVLDLAVTYALGEGGLSVSTTATNSGDMAVPFGFGAHPYLALGSTPLAEVELQVPATHEVRVDERMLPVGTEPVRPEVDFREARALGSARLDTAFTGLSRRDDGTWDVTVSGLHGRPDVAVWGDQAFGWAQVFTDQGADEGVQGVRGIAVEPMSCPADAFNSGEGLVVLEPGQSWMGTWGIAPRLCGGGAR